MKDAQYEGRLEDNLHVETSKSLATIEKKNKELALKLVTADKDRKSTEAGLKNAQTLVEEQSKKLNYTEIQLATTNQQFETMKAKLEKTKEAAQAAVDASEQKFYDLGVKETEVFLTDKLVEDCRDYCLKVWTEALILTRVPVASEWKKAENVYYPQDLRETPEADRGFCTNTCR